MSELEWLRIEVGKLRQENKFLKSKTSISIAKQETGDYVIIEFSKDKSTMKLKQKESYIKQWQVKRFYMLLSKLNLEKTLIKSHDVWKEIIKNNNLKIDENAFNGGGNNRRRYYFPLYYYPAKVLEHEGLIEYSRAGIKLKELGGKL